jgi:hypothetical protein
MGEWKAQVSIRIRQGTRAEIEGFAARERRTMSNVSELLLECGIAHLKTAGSIEQLVRTLPRAEQFGGDSGSAQRPKDKEPVLRSPKFQITLRIRPALKRELEEVARREKHTFGTLAALLLEWGYEQLTAVGATERLQPCGIPFSENKTQPVRTSEESFPQEPKPSVAPGVREDVWKGMKDFALREDKRLSRLAEVVLEWSALQLRVAGSMERLRKYKIRP